MNKKTNVLMYVWEFPPYIAGGLGMACYGMAKSLASSGEVNLKLILPNVDQKKHGKGYHDYLADIKVDQVHSIDTQYEDRPQKSSYTSSEPLKYPDIPLDIVLEKGYQLSGVKIDPNYNEHLYHYVDMYAERAGNLACMVDHDIIQCHDWLTIKAGIKAKQISGKPLIFQVHALEVDRNFHGLCQHIYDIEQQGMWAADKIVAVSEYTKRKILECYHYIDPNKIVVVHNGNDVEPFYDYKVPPIPKPPKKVVLFMGRMTEQKGVYYFIQMAKRILGYRQDIDFLLGGKGDQYNWMLNHVAECGLGKHIHFTGFLDQSWVKTAFKIADVFVMPSRSEPFGLVGLEAVEHDTPVIFSKQSGVAEVFSEPMTVDYWDVERMAEQVEYLLDNPDKAQSYLAKLKQEAKKCTWDKAAFELVDIYRQFGG